MFKKKKGTRDKRERTNDLGEECHPRARPLIQFQRPLENGGMLISGAAGRIASSFDESGQHLRVLHTNH